MGGEDENEVFVLWGSEWVQYDRYREGGVVLHRLRVMSAFMGGVFG